MKIVKSSHIPFNSIIEDKFGRIDYSDSYRVDVKDINKYSVDYLTELIFSIKPPLVEFMMKLRNTIVKPLGLKTESDGVEKRIDSSKDSYKPGDRVVIFKVAARNDHEIVLGENDKHLDFRTSLLIEENSASLTTIVRFNNVIGKLYFLPVKPFHRFIVKSILKSFKEKVENPDSLNA